MVDPTLVAFWNWTRISLALEDYNDEEYEATVEVEQNTEDQKKSTLLISICAIIGGALTIWLLYRYSMKRSLYHNLTLSFLC